MRGIGKEFYIGAIVLFLYLWYAYRFTTAYAGTILIVGNYYFFGNVILAYWRLKAARFNFRAAMTKKEWKEFIWDNIIVWALFFTCPWVVYEFSIILSLVLFPLLWLYDKITDIFKY